MGRWLFALALLGIVLFTISTLVKVTAESIFLIILSYFMIAGLTLWLSILFSTKVWDFILPSIVFAIGEGVARYEKIKKLRSNIFWCVLVAAAIGVLVDLILK